MCGPHQVWPLRSECCGRGVPTKVVCAECMKMCCPGGKNSVVKGLIEFVTRLHVQLPTMFYVNNLAAAPNFYIVTLRLSPQYSGMARDAGTKVPVHPVPSYTGLRLSAIIGHCLRDLDFSLTLVYYPGDLDIPPPPPPPPPPQDTWSSSPKGIRLSPQYLSLPNFSPSPMLVHCPRDLDVFPKDTWSSPKGFFSPMLVHCTGDIII